ncbi:MAG: T9SS type A sorting domain-containing protein [Bacteroidia bacterium]|nr:T9SS type A sorting domain-containing protein [Bacteroidia bacterium]
MITFISKTRQGCAWLVATFLLASSLFAQNPIDINNISAGTQPAGLFFYDSSGDPNYEVPRGSGKHCNYASSVWIGGLDGQDNLHLAAATYSQGGIDFRAGAIGDSYATHTQRYYKVWRVSKSAIDYHKATYNQPGYLVPAEISAWPAHGDVSNGESRELAPYVDLNGNNNYEPEQGDYPAILGDQALYVIFNDDVTHYESGGLPLNVEIHCMMYGWDDPSRPEINNTLFMHFTVFNRSQIDYHDTYFGFFDDFEIGNYLDDYLGSDPALDAFFGYNGDNNDEGPTGYGTTPPALAVTFLNRSLTSFMYFENSSTAYGNPDSARNYYDYMQSTWKDGSHLTWGGNGHNGWSPTNYAFPSDPGTGWSCVSPSMIPGDMRGVGSTGPFDLQAGSFECFDLAITYARASGGTQNFSVSTLKAQIPLVKSWYANHNPLCGVSSVVGEEEELTQDQHISVFPNPGNGTFYVELPPNLVSDGVNLRLYTSTGQLFQKKRLEKGNADTVIPFQGLSPGIYLLEVQSNSGKFTHKVVVTN